MIASDDITSQSEAGDPETDQSEAGSDQSHCTLIHYEAVPGPMLLWAADRDVHVIIPGIMAQVSH